jgi:hypothetical protein
LDLDSVPVGIEFRDLLTESVLQCDVVLALLGDKWMSVTDEAGKSRLETDDDYLRFEIEFAMSREIPVIPVLLGDVTMPSAEELPPSLRDFALKNAMRISSGPGFDHDLTRVIESLPQRRALALVECVNCYETVIPKADGLCPACGQNAKQITDDDQAVREGHWKAMIRVQEGARLPPICCSCATPTERLVKIRRSRALGGESLFVRLVVSPIYWWDSKPTSRDVTVYLPQCKACSRKIPVKPMYVDFERGTMKFVVHRTFRRHCQAPP